MTKYIPLDTLITEIKRLDSLYHTSKDLSGDLFIQGLFCFLDTTEVKEVNLEKEISFQWSKFCLNSKDNDSFIKVVKHFFELGACVNSTEVKDVDLENIATAEWDDYVRKIDGEPDTAYMLIKREDYIVLAKHFFELRLKVQKGE